MRPHRSAKRSSARRSDASAYRGVFINLARSTRRRATLVRHLKEIGVVSRYERFEAVDGRAVAARFPTELDPGNLGIWLTHEALLRTHRSLGLDLHLHILEDDTVLAKRARQKFEQVLSQADALSSWDLLFTDIFVPLSVQTFRVFVENIDRHAQSGRHALVDLASIGFASCCSMFVNKRSVAKYARLIRGNWALGMPLDLFIRQLVHQGALRAYVTVPFLTSIADSVQSDVRGRTDRSRQVCDVLRRGLFEEADHPALLARMRALTKGARLSDRAALFVKAESFSLSDQWTPF